jgi:AraC-like DNA-binding protein
MQDEPRDSPQRISMFVSVLIVRGLLSELRRRGLDERLAMREAGLDELRLSDLGATVSLSEWSRLASNAQALSQDPALALSAGRHFPVSALQLVGHLVRDTRSLREAIQVFLRYAPLLTDHFVWSLTERGTWARFACESPYTRGDETRFGLELAISLALHVGRRLAPGAHGERVQLELSYPAPAHAAEYARLLDCEVHFDQPACAIVFGRELLDVRRDAIQDPRLTLPVRERAERLLLERTHTDLAARVRKFLQLESDLRTFDANRLAAAFNLTERALRRQLVQEGKPLSTLLAEVRLATAIRELSSGTACIQELSDRLGFSEPSAFHRAFKRWTGKTPATFVREHARRDDARQPRRKAAPSVDDLAEGREARG